MTDLYIESKLMAASELARDLLAWHSIRAEERLAGSPHLHLNIKDKDDDYMNDVHEFLMHR